MKLYDISINLHEGMVTWPGDPEVKIDWVARIGEGSDANISALNYGLHTGTHIDVPLHFVKDGWSMDELDLGVLVGACEVVQVPDDCDLIGRQDLEALEIECFERVLFKTRNSQSWPKDAVTFDKDFVALGPSGADYLVEKGCKLVGIDYLSIAPFDDPPTTHVRLLEAGVVILEGLDLSGVEPGRYELICLPIKLMGREGAPARAILRALGD
jgi:arylformamidase